MKLALPMRSRSGDVLRPAVELINFNLNVIKICGFPAFSLNEKNGAAQESAVLQVQTLKSLTVEPHLCTWPVHVCKSLSPDANKKTQKAKGFF